MTLAIERTPIGLVTFTINRPQARNALDLATQNQFLEALHEVTQDSSTRVLIITGAGEQAFCAGGDLLELAQYTDESDGEILTSIMGDALNLLENAPFPSIAAINGDAFGGGCELALACDLRLIAPHAKLSFVQLRMGLTPGWGAGQRLLRLVGYSQSLYLLLSAQAQTAAAALQLGLVNQVVDEGSVLAAAHHLAAGIAALDQAGVAAVKRVLRYGLTLPYPEAQAAERAEFPPLWAAPAHLAAVEAFLNRKKE